MSVFRLGARVSIGSGEESDIRIEDKGVAAQHCTIDCTDGRYMLSDLDGRDGTFINGIPVKQREIASGDEIAVGNSAFLFSAEKQHPGEGSEVRLKERNDAAAQVQQVRYEELPFLRPESLAALPAPERMARNLSVLLRISTGIGGMRDVELLEWTLLGMVFDVIPAERGAILLLDEETREVQSHTAWDRVQGPDHAVQVSPGILKRVTEERISILENAGSAEGGTGELEAQSIVCAPLGVGERVFGVLYLDTTNSATRFREEDLELVSAIASLTAIGIENARQFERLTLENQQLRAEVSLTHGRKERANERGVPVHRASGTQ